MNRSSTSNITHELELALETERLLRKDAVRRCVELEAQVAALREDAERYRALQWADGELLEGDRNNISNHWEYKPAGYDGNNCNRYYLGSIPRSFRECADFAVAARKP